MRARVDGKFLWVGDEKLYVRGTTYGTFKPGDGVHPYPDPAVVEADFACMAAHGLNAVRLYTTPPEWLLDHAHAQGLKALVGLPWEQHVTLLDDRARRRSVARRVGEGVRACAGHPAVLGYAVGNEIPASVVRWHGAREVESFLHRLTDVAHEEDPDALVTYVNFPPTEYLDLPFLDFCAFNVYLEREEQLAEYLPRLHVLAGDRPLMLAEVGLDSRRNGLDTQARTLAWQIERAFAGGCAGLFVFAWTDDWYMQQEHLDEGGFAVDDWDFGVTDRERRSKPALAAVSGAFARTPIAADAAVPRVSVVVCAHNAEDTLEECLDGLARVRYADMEVIVVDDGSTDATAALADRPNVRLIRTPPQGLSAARNVGLDAATGDIVAYIDSDAWPDPDWLTYVAYSLATSDHVAIGGPNLPPEHQGDIARCVSHAPGGPVHVLLDHVAAEHIPGCNMAFRRSALETIGGFDARFRAAGDDVDLCWRLLDAGHTIGFNPAAVVWHHRRGSVRGYLRQQRGYGRAEALLERKWPERYSPAGQARWEGRLYGGVYGSSRLHGRRHVRYGVWGTNLFQSVYQSHPGSLAAITMAAEWYLVIAALSVLALAGVLWAPLLAAVPLLVAAVALKAVEAVAAARRADLRTIPVPRRRRMRALIAALHLLQPLARLSGRLGGGLTPWRLRAASPAVPRSRRLTRWSESWHAPTAWVAELETRLGDGVVRGGEWDRWDLEVRAGMLGGGRIHTAVEEHGQGRQMFRARFSPCAPPGTPVLIVLLAILAGVALADGAALAAAVVGAGALGVLFCALHQAATAAGSFVHAMAAVEPGDGTDAP